VTTVNLPHPQILEQAVVPGHSKAYPKRAIGQGIPAFVQFLEEHDIRRLRRFGQHAADVLEFAGAAILHHREIVLGVPVPQAVGVEGRHFDFVSGRLDHTALVQEGLAKRRMVPPHHSELDGRLVDQPFLDEQRPHVAFQRHHPFQQQRRAVEPRLGSQDDLFGRILDDLGFEGQQRNFPVQPLVGPQVRLAGPPRRRQHFLPAAEEVVVERAFGQRAGGDERLAHGDGRLPEEIQVARLVREVKDVGALVQQDADAHELVFEVRDAHPFVRIVQTDAAAAVSSVGIHGQFFRLSKQNLLRNVNTAQKRDYSSLFLKTANS